MMKRRDPLVPFALLLAFAAFACDPGISLCPTGWGRPTDYRWSKDIEGVHLQIGSLGGLIGSMSVSPELVVDNPTHMSFVVEGGTLETGGKSYEMQLPGKGEERWRSAAPHSEARISLWFNFERPLYEAIGTEATVTFRYRLGSRPNVFIVNFQKK